MIKQIGLPMAKMEGLLQCSSESTGNDYAPSVARGGTDIAYFNPDLDFLVGVLVGDKSVVIWDLSAVGGSGRSKTPSNFYAAELNNSKDVWSDRNCSISLVLLL